MGHKSEDFFIRELNNARKLIKIGEYYQHSKTKQNYIVKDLVIIEETEEIGVVYQAEYGEKLIWVRTVENFTELVEINGEKMQRFKMTRAQNEKRNKKPPFPERYFHN